MVVVKADPVSAARGAQCAHVREASTTTARATAVQWLAGWMDGSACAFVTLHTCHCALLLAAGLLTLFLPCHVANILNAPPQADTRRVAPTSARVSSTQSLSVTGSSAPVSSSSSTYASAQPSQLSSSSSSAFTSSASLFSSSSPAHSSRLSSSGSSSSLGMYTTTARSHTTNPKSPFATQPAGSARPPKSGSRPSSASTVQSNTQQPQQLQQSMSILERTREILLSATEGLYRTSSGTDRSLDDRRQVTPSTVLAGTQITPSSQPQTPPPPPSSLSSMAAGARSGSPSPYASGPPSQHHGSVASPAPPASAAGSYSSGHRPSRASEARGHRQGLHTHHETPSPSRKDIVIHVFDESRNVKRDFYCKRSLLLREMKYFGSYLTDSQHATECVDIDVHCDVEVFEWLISYISKSTVSLEPRSAVSILISSSFLQMAGLELQCIEYIHDHMNEIILVPINLKCINRDLISK
ncbi:hypothetical protein BC831DRAFT_92117 [Entophlyctis helioformis]|nr:hypothetical protein BC831DRAFT_92117 [Entophlyctis helioformis]